MEDKLSRIIDYTEIYLDSKLDFEDIYKKLKELYVEYKLPSNLENHTTENMDELLDDDEFFYYAVPVPKQLRYITGLYIIDSMWGGYDCEFAYMDIIYNKEREISTVDMSTLNALYNEHLKKMDELKHDVEEVLPTKNYKGNCTKEFCRKIIDENIYREFESIQDIDFPLVSFSIPTLDTCKNEFNRLIKSNGKLSSKGTSEIIKLFHRSRMFANVGSYLSPYEGWQFLKSDINEFASFYENRLRYADWFKDNPDCLVEGKVRGDTYGIGLSTSRKFPFVTYFKPMLAKYIINKYLKDYSTIFDPFSGYSGRMLGTLASNKKYIGHDLCEYSIEESKKIHLFITDEFDNVPECTLEVKDVLTDSGKYECLFTCPPYENIENWPGVPQLNYSCDKWIDICLNNFDCERYVFVVDDKIEKYKKFIKEEIVNTSHFSKNKEYIVVIDNKDLNS